MTSTGTKIDLDELWEACLKRKESHAREQLLVHYLPIVKQLAGRMKIGLPGSVEYDDLVSTGLIGLINSIDNFKPELGYKFETYATRRIKGAILDGLRDVDWLPRSYRQKSRKLDRTMSNLAGKLGRMPDDHEIAADLGFNAEEYDKFLIQVGAASLVSLDVQMSTGEAGETGSLHEVIPDTEAVDPLARVEENDARTNALKLIRELSEQERAVVALYYFEELTFREIGKVIGVSESRICQIHTKIISKLRVRLAKMLE